MVLKKTCSVYGAFRRVSCSNLCLRGFTTIDESNRSTPGKPLGDENWSEVILTPGKIDIASWKAGRTTITSEDIAFSPRNR